MADGACCEGQDETTAATTLTTDDSSLTMNPLANETSPATDAADPATTLSPHDTSTAEPQSTNATNPTVPPEVAGGSSHFQNHFECRKTQLVILK